jgi:hypothetical protein
MGTIADAVLGSGGQVIGVIPEALVSKEIAHHGVSDLRVVRSMHERKAEMAALSDGFIAMAGGLGTLDEFFEVLTWAQLGLHQKPCGLLNVSGYYDHIVSFLDCAEGQGFIPAASRSMLIVESDPAALLDRFESYRAPHLKQWLDPSQV